MNIKILSWNIWFNCHFDKISDFISKTNADIIGLQEVVLEDHERDIVTFLKKAGYEYAIAPSAEFTDQENKLRKLHNVIFSKFPIIESRVHVLRDGKRPSVIEARIQIHDKIISVFSIHLKHTHQQRLDIQDMQAERLVSLLPAMRGIVMGDFNATPDGYPVQLIEKKYTNTDKTYAPTWSVYPEGCPTCKPQKIDTRLDYIFVSPDITFTSPEVGVSDGSDHLPILVSIEM